jgi:hypothetical protein
MKPHLFMTPMRAEHGKSAGRSAELGIRATMVTDTIKAAYLEELRFAKRQQWTITAAVVAFIAGAYCHAARRSQHHFAYPKNG